MKGTYTQPSSSSGMSLSDSQTLFYEHIVINLCIEQNRQKDSILIISDSTSLRSQWQPTNTGWLRGLVYLYIILLIISKNNNPKVQNWTFKSTAPFHRQMPASRKWQCELTLAERTPEIVDWWSQPSARLPNPPFSQLVQLAGPAPTQVEQVWSHRWHWPSDWYFPLEQSVTQRPSSSALHLAQTRKLCLAAQYQLTSIINSEKNVWAPFCWSHGETNCRLAACAHKRRRRTWAIELHQSRLIDSPSQWFLSIKRFILVGWVSSALNKKSKHWKIQISAPRILMNTWEKRKRSSDV